MNPLCNPFFWAFLSMFALVAACPIVSSKKFGKNAALGASIVAVFTLGRIFLVLPFCLQPRLEVGGWHWVIGGIIFVIGLVFGLPALNIKPFTAPDEKETLQTTGFYGIVRNPIYLCDVLWALGIAIMFRSIIGIALTPLWWVGLLCVVIIEEQSLERELGRPYLEYKKKVRGRIFPGLPI